MDSAFQAVTQTIVEKPETGKSQQMGGSEPLGIVVLKTKVLEGVLAAWEGTSVSPRSRPFLEESGQR